MGQDSSKLGKKARTISGVVAGGVVASVLGNQLGDAVKNEVIASGKDYDQRFLAIGEKPVSLKKFEELKLTPFESRKAITLEQQAKVRYALDWHWDDVAIALIRDLGPESLSPDDFSFACQSGRVEFVKAMLELGYNASVIEMEELKGGHVETKGWEETTGGLRPVNILVGAKLDIDVFSAFYEAAQGKNSYLLRNPQYGRKSCVSEWIVVYEDNPNTVEVLKLLLPKFQGKIDEKWGQWKRTALVYACWTGCWFNAKFLIDSGADVSIPDEYGVTPLTHALRERDSSGSEGKPCMEIAILLIEHGAVVTPKILELVKGEGYDKVVQAQKSYREKQQ